MRDRKTLEKFSKLQTPFYYYDLDRLRGTLEVIKNESEKSGYIVHYAVKANHNKRLLQIIASYGLGADCVSGNEVLAAIDAGFKPSDVVFAGVGKTDKEITAALKAGIFCFNCESIPEIEVINEIASDLGKTARIALRINPNVDAHTHHYITTGVEESKFGIDIDDIEKVVNTISGKKNIKLIGMHFHIGSQITDLPVFKKLCKKINELQELFVKLNVKLEVINIGGGLGIDYMEPENDPKFTEYFKLIRENIKVMPGQVLHMEPGRSIIGQCGNLITKVVFVKKAKHTNFAIVDAGMTDLIRPALYQAHHKIENISSSEKPEKYDVVGPICESSDTFDKGIELAGTKRGDLLAIRSAGAYGEAMASRYNLRDLPQAVFSDDLR
jgi:diaminopimelate decarboxylase